MKSVIAAALALMLLGCQGTGSKKVTLENKLDKVSYGIGLNIGRNLKRDSVTVNPDALFQGIKDASLDSSAARMMTDSAVESALTEFQEEMRAKQTANMQAQAAKNKTEGDAFLEANKSKEGVVTLPSGLQYKVITQGTGPVPKPNQTVTANYRGTLVDGTEFDSSFKRGEPAQFPVTGVIPGWTEALLKMKVGSKWMLYIPSNLAYGERGAGRMIPPNATLVFELELLGVK